MSEELPVQFEKGGIIREPLVPLIGNLLFLNFMKDSSFYSIAVWLLWLVIGISLLLVSMAFDSPQLLFTLYGAGAFIILMSFTTFL